LKVWEWTCSILGDLEQDVESSVAGFTHTARASCFREEQY
jgi:hypothetical protein